MVGYLLGLVGSTLHAVRTWWRRLRARLLKRPDGGLQVVDVGPDWISVEMDEVEAPLSKRDIN